MRPTWYRDAVIYQVEPSLFHDANADGCGDLRGVTERLDHIRGLGANCLWLLPMYASQLRDGGYDVTDHLSIDPRFGDMADMSALLDKADDLGLHVMVDLVVQHTSDQHPWFQEARRDRSSPYRDYYMWTDDPEDDPRTIEPVFPGVEDSVWSWDEAAGQYYRHAFYSFEPDLNHAHPPVIEEIERIMAFWLRLGVAGFRVDAVPYMVETAARADGVDDGFWLVRRLREFVYLHRPGGILMGEVDVPPEEYSAYFGDGDGFSLLLDFWVNNHLWLALARESAEPLVRAVRGQPRPPRNTAYAVFVRNHDELDLEQLTEDERDEVLETFAPEKSMRAYGRGIRRRTAPMLDGDDARIAMVHALQMSLPGSPVVLYGDEIGLGENLDLAEREAVRTPMQWTEEADAGFSSAPPDQWAAPPTPGDFSARHRNVLSQTQSRESLLARIGTMARTRTGLGDVGAGTCEVLDVGTDAVLGLRYVHGDRDVWLLTNLSGQQVIADLGEDVPDDLVDLVSDADYSEALPRSLALNRYGYRWLRPRGDLFR